MERVGKRSRSKLFKFVFNFQGEGNAAMVYDVEAKTIRFGGALKFEMVMRKIVKRFFNAKNIRINCDREIKYKRRLEDRSGQVRYEWRTRRNGRIVFRFKCPNWQFKVGYKKMGQVRSEGKGKGKGELEFTEVESIGRIFN